MSAIRFRILPTSYEQNQADQQRNRLNKVFLITLFLLPGMAIFFIFLLMPISQSFFISQYKWNGLGPMTTFVGMDNFTNLFKNPTFVSSLLHSVTLMMLSLCIQLPLALGLALLVGRGNLRGRRIFRGILFIPFVFSEIITAIIWLYVFKPSDGLANVFLSTIIPGFQPVAWLGERDIVLYSIFAIITWKYFGLHMLLYMAGLQSIPKDLEDAARVDGASERGVLRYITLPLLGSTIRLTVFLSVLGSFQQFVIIWTTTQGGPVNASSVIATFLFKFGVIQQQLGFGSAVAVVLFAITLIFSLGYQRIILRRDYAADSI